MIALDCPKCGEALEFADELLDLTGDCHQCGSVVYVREKQAKPEESELSGRDLVRTTAFVCCLIFAVCASIFTVGYLVRKEPTPTVAAANATVPTVASRTLSVTNDSPVSQKNSPNASNTPTKTRSSDSSSESTDGSVRDYFAAFVSLALLIFCIVAAIAFYLLPLIIAAFRKHHNLAPIAVVNICFGWSFLGWVASLAWSLSSPNTIQIVHDTRKRGK